MRLKPFLMSLAATIGLALPASAGLGPAKLLPNDRVVFLGDSITFLGVADPDYNGWFNIFQQQMENTMPVTLIDSGVGGYTTTNGLENFSRLVLNLKPSVVVIWLGLNDIDTFTPSHTTHVNIESMVALALDAGIREIILVSPMGHGEKQDGGNPTYDPQIDKLSSFMFNIAADDKSGRVFYMPMRAMFLNEEKKINPSGNANVLLRPDGIHPNGVGHLFIDQAFLTEFGFTGLSLAEPMPAQPSAGVVAN
jgi:lysophospholipase L1-like esterase